MSIDFLTGLFQFAVLAKVFLLVLILFYLVFTVVVYRQAALMNQTLSSNVSPLVRLAAIGQILLVGGLFFLAIFLA